MFVPQAGDAVGDEIKNKRRPGSRSKPSTIDLQYISVKQDPYLLGTDCKLQKFQRKYGDFGQVLRKI